MRTTIKFPKDLSNVVYEYFTKENELNDFLNSENLLKYHFNLGMYLRNHYKLWEKKFYDEYNLLIHPDDVSSYFVEESQKILKANKMNYLLDTLKEEMLKVRDAETALKNICKKMNGELVDAYGGFISTDLISKEKFYVPNAYGQEDNWYDLKQNENEVLFDFVVVYKNRVEFLIFENSSVKTDIVYFDFDIDLSNFGGKRGYYLYENKLLLRTTNNFYKTLPKDYKNSESEKWCSAPHFSINLKNKRI